MADPVTWRERIPSWVIRGCVVVALAALVAWSTWQRWQILGASPFPVGIDGYFYPIQLRSLLETGHLQYPASPLAFWWMAPFAAATDPILGAKLGAALGGALIAVPAYHVGGRLGGGRGPGLLAAAIATTSQGSTYLSIEFVKNGIGLTVALVAVWFVLRTFERSTRVRIALAVLGFVAAILAHKMAAVIVVVVCGPAVIAELYARRGIRWVLPRLAVGAAGLALAGIAIGLAAPRRFPSFADLGLLEGLVTRTARWDAPALATPNITLTMHHEALAGAIFAIVAAVMLVLLHPSQTPSRPRREAVRALGLTPGVPSAGTRAAGWAIVGIALVIGLPWLAVDDSQALGFRLRLAAFVPLALCVALASRVLIARLHAIDATGLLLVIALAIVVRAPTVTHVDGQIVAHPAMVSACLGFDGKIPPAATAVVPERHIMFMIAWYTRARVALRPSSATTTLLVRILPLAFIDPPLRGGAPLDAALLAARGVPDLAPPIGTHARHPNGLVLVPEATWAWALDHLPARDRAHFAAWPTL